MELPIDFTIRMKNMLGKDFDNFLSTYSQPHHSSLRLNPFKDSSYIQPLLSKSIPWAENAFYFDPNTTAFGKLPYHNMGLYYIQEPSAMFPVEVLDVNENDIVLDLCAAPGGKSTQIAFKLKNTGLLVSNEIVPKRANILKDNISRMGITNTIVTNETPENISKRYDGYFDKILVDAPCSGEGMFRKNPEAISEWSLENVSMCAERQLPILNTIKNCLKPGGTLVYSTCTFSPEENEQVIEQFLLENPDFTLSKIDNKYFSKGIISNTKTNLKDIEKTVRIFPHITKGEGHFVAKLIKENNAEEYPLRTQKSTANKKSVQLWNDFSKAINKNYKGLYLQFGDNVYLAPEYCPNLDKVKIVYSGLLLGSVENNRFTPSHELALSLTPNQINNKIELSDNELNSYLHGETISTKTDIQGWTLITYQNNPVGWGKSGNGTIKNHYPKYLRI